MKNTWAWVYGDECDFLWEHFDMENRNPNDRMKIKFIDFDKMKNGDKYEVLARFDDPDSNQHSVVRFYKTINRGDRRVSIKGIKQYANIGDLIGLSACLPKDDNKDIIIINVTRRANQ